MRKVVLYQLLTLDGVAEEPGDWFADGGPELFDNLGRVIASQDLVLLGRGTYDYWVDYWPSSDVEPFASFVNGTDKHVFTADPPEPAWANTTFVSSPAEQHVADFKGQPGGDIGIHGSISLSQSLLRAGLVDELRLVVAAAVAGHGRRLFPDGDDPVRRLDLVDVERTAAGSLFLTYRTPVP
jgi:dihydrofolate reductase